MPQMDMKDQDFRQSANTTSLFLVCIRQQLSFMVLRNQTLHVHVAPPGSFEIDAGCKALLNRKHMIKAPIVQDPSLWTRTLKLRLLTLGSFAAKSMVRGLLHILKRTMFKAVSPLPQPSPLWEILHRAELIFFSTLSVRISRLLAYLLARDLICRLGSNGVRIQGCFGLGFVRERLEMHCYE
jgi:hypothetical protein